MRLSDDAWLRSGSNLLRFTFQRNGARLCSHNVPARPITAGREPSAIALADLVSAARAQLTGRLDAEGARDALRSLICVGTSAGGARARAVVAFNPRTSQIRSNQLDAPDGYEQWLIKLDVSLTRLAKTRRSLHPSSDPEHRSGGSSLPITGWPWPPASP